MYMFSKRKPFGFLSKLMRTLILPQLDGPQMITRIVLGSISPCLRFSAQAFHHSWFRVTVCDAHRQRLQYKFHAHTKGCALSNDYLKAWESENRAVIKCISRCVLPKFETWAPSSCNIYRRSYASMVTTSNVWDKLPEHVKADSEVRTYRRALQSAVAADASSVPHQR